MNISYEASKAIEDIEIEEEINFECMKFDVLEIEKILMINK